MDSDEYEDSVKKMKDKGYPGLSKEEIKKLEENWIPHKGFLRFAHHIIYSFDTTEEAGIPLEYRSFPVNQIIPFYPTPVNYQGIDNLERIMQLVKQKVNTDLFYGEVCQTAKHIVHRKFNNTCVPHSCEYGYYMVKADIDFSCQIRVDPYLPIPPKETKYMYNATFSLPYANVTQEIGVWFDEAAEKEKVSYFNETDYTIWDIKG